MDDLFELNPAKLGFGLMRLPQKDAEIDKQQLCEMVDCFLDGGFTYFDVAYNYHGGAAESAAGECLVARRARDSFTLATKLPMWMVEQKEDMQRIFTQQLQRTGAGYFDFYLLHSLTQKNVELADSYGAWDFVRKLRDSGAARHIGFSFHDSPQLLEKLLTEHPEFEFVQLQINYADWDNPDVRARECYETARRFGKPVSIMEPIKGGALTELAPAARSALQEADKSATAAEWALRFVFSLDGVFAVLSGMSNLQQLRENICTVQDMKPLDDAGRKAIEQAVRELEKLPTIPCTRCGYCQSGCPQGIPIPTFFTIMNNYTRFNFLPPVESSYKANAEKYRVCAGDCIACGQCESVCPQHIDIIERLKEISQLLD